MDVRDLVKQGRVQEAMSRLRAHLARKPEDPGALFQLGQLLLAQRRTRSAERCLADVVRQWPEHARAHAFHAECLRADGRLSEAESAYRKAVELDPADADAPFRLATLLHEAGRVDAARDAYLQVLERNPANAHAHNNLAALLLQAGALEPALSHYVEALRHAPALSSARLSLASISARLGRPEVAADHYRAVLVRDPGNEIALRGLGDLLLARTQAGTRTLAEAEACWRTLSERYPDDRELMGNLGVVLGRQGRHEEAAALFERVIRGGARRGRGDDFVVGVELVENYAMALAEAKRLDEALHIYAQLHANQPANVDLAAELAALRLECVDWAGLPELLDSIAASPALPSGKCRPLRAQWVPGLSASQHLAFAGAHGALVLPPLSERSGVQAPPGDTLPRRLRIAYVSPDLRTHPVGILLAGVLERHDHEGFEVFAYSSGVDDRSEWRCRFEAAADVFRDVRELEDDAVAECIRKDGIDILVDLSGWTEGERLATFARRPAPVQVGWLGYPGTVGVKGLLDYIIGDKVVTPLADAPHYTETIAQLPHCYLPNDDSRPLLPAPERASEGLPEEAVVLCCFNQVYKITPAAMDAWVRVLQAVPDAVLWLRPDKDAAVMERLIAQFVGRGVARERIVWADRKASVDEHVARLQLADLALDTWPYNSHATAADTLWAGVPLVTLRGNTFAGRVGESQLRALGLEHLVAEDVDAYVEKAIALARDRDALRSLRTGLRRRRKTRPLFDTARFARDLERMYREMWRQHLAGERAPISLDPA
jgi:predicted O-linked N-acetylglucosamine transferase (SPINDLY family)